MLSSLLLGLCLAKSIVAAPAPAQIFDVTPVEGDVVVLLEDGNNLIINYTTWVQKITYEGFSLTRPKHDPESLNYSGIEKAELVLNFTDIDFPEGNAGKRDVSCENTNQLTVDKTERFVDWDVQMSNVVCASFGAMDVWVMSGWSVANTVTISAGLELGSWIKGKLGPSVGVDFSRTWTSTQSVQNKGSIADKHCGVMITQPLTTRRSGRVLQGCLGQTRQVSTWYADDHGSGSYNGVSWIAGAVNMCSKPGTSPPMTRCNGQGEFV